jgi:hypothetical protein
LIPGLSNFEQKGDAGTNGIDGISATGVKGETGQVLTGINLHWSKWCWNKRYYWSKGDTGINGIDSIKQFSLDHGKEGWNKWCWE